MANKLFKGETKAERRKFPRLSLKLWVHFQLLQPGDLASKLEGLAEDLGAGGLAMRTDRALNVDQMLMVTLYIPPKDKRGNPQETLIYNEDECEPVQILTRVAWIKPLEDEEYACGVQFLDLDVDNRMRLKTFLVDYQLDQADSSLYT